MVFSKYSWHDFGRSAEIRDGVDTTIKWSRAVKNDLAKGKEYKFDKRQILNTYRLADYKPQVIDLLQRVCTVSVKTMTMTIARAMGEEE